MMYILVMINKILSSVICNIMLIWEMKKDGNDTIMKK